MSLVFSLLLKLKKLFLQSSSDSWYIDCMFLSCHVPVSEWTHTLWLPECQGTPCSKQVRNNTVVKRDIAPPPPPHPAPPHHPKLISKIVLKIEFQKLNLRLTVFAVYRIKRYVLNDHSLPFISPPPLSYLKNSISLKWATFF